jgi:hypothetical protein
MAELWTFSGINSSDGNGGFTDYVGEAFLKNQLPMPPGGIARRFVSRLGTSKQYPGPANLLRVDSRARLNAEAAEMARSGVSAGALRGREILVVLIAPKTGTPLPPSFSGQVEIYWGSYDLVPSQGILRPDSLTYWRRWSENVWPLRTRHGLSGFLHQNLKVAKRVRQRIPGASPPRHRYTWIDTATAAPSLKETLEPWLLRTDNPLIFVAHSQGTNIALHVLAQGA